MTANLNLNLVKPVPVPQPQLELKPTHIRTTSAGINLQVSPSLCGSSVQVHFGLAMEPGRQSSGNPKDFRELAQVFLDIAEYLEDRNAP